MKILSIDTTSNICGVSILENTKLICSLDTNTGRTHSENLMPMIKEAFTKSNLTLQDINLITCDIGPGSFTGIRIGVSTAKAFGDSLNIPCIGINSLEVLAYNIKDDIQENEFICSIIDCKNDNCYFAFYEKKNSVLENLIEPQAESIETCLAILKSYCEDTLENPSLYFVGDGSDIYKTAIQKVYKHANFAANDSNLINSYSLGIAGFDNYKSRANTKEVLPLYLKKPQAQRQLEEKQNNHFRKD